MKLIKEIARGFANSVIIEAHCDEPGIAAKRCLNVVSEGYDDWFLPSIGTLEELMLQRSIINAELLTLRKMFCRSFVVKTQVSSGKNSARFIEYFTEFIHGFVVSGCSLGIKGNI